MSDSSSLSASVRRATPADAQAIAELVNVAYAVEGFFVEGPRTSAAEITQLMAAGGTFLVLDREPAEGHRGVDQHVAKLGGAVYVTTSGRRGYFGMLAVGSGLQGHGLGKRLVRIAEAVCEAAGCTEMTMNFVNLREELGRWYRSLGYRQVGTAPYAARKITQPCHFVEMVRPLGMSSVLAA